LGEGQLPNFRIPTQTRHFGPFILPASSVTADANSSLCHLACRQPLCRLYSVAEPGHASSLTPVSLMCGFTFTTLVICSIVTLPQLFVVWLGFCDGCLLCVDSGACDCICHTETSI